MVFLCEAEFWTPRIARGKKGSGPRLTFDLKWALSNLKMKPEKLELESAHPEIGLDKICLAKFEQNGQPKERSNSASKMGCQFCQKSKMGKE